MEDTEGPVKAKKRDRLAVNVVQQLIDSGAVERAIAVLVEGLEAKTEGGKPSWRDRNEAARQVLDRVDGKPVERIHRIDEKRSIPSLDELVASPAARDALREALAKAEGVVKAREAAVLDA